MTSTQEHCKVTCLLIYGKDTDKLKRSFEGKLNISLFTLLFILKIIFNLVLTLDPFKRKK